MRNALAAFIRSQLKESVARLGDTSAAAKGAVRVPATIGVGQQMLVPVGNA